jgi:hypothetical protein
MQNHPVLLLGLKEPTPYGHRSGLNASEFSVTFQAYSQIVEVLRCSGADEKSSVGGTRVTLSQRLHEDAGVLSWFFVQCDHSPCD